MLRKCTSQPGGINDESMCFLPNEEIFKTLSRCHTHSVSRLALLSQVFFRLACDFSIGSGDYRREFIAEIFSFGRETFDSALLVSLFKCPGTLVHIRLAPAEETINQGG